MFEKNMKKAIIFALITAIILATALQIARAYDFRPHGREYVIDFDDGISYRDYRYIDYYGRPIYGVYYKDNYEDDEFSYYEKLRAVRFLQSSFNYRYDLTAGKTSGEAFGGDNAPGQSYSNWRNKP